MILRNFFVFCYISLFCGLNLYANTPYNWSQLTPSGSPSAREFPSKAFNPCSGQVTMFGGVQNGNYLNETWVYESNTESWTQLTTATSPPGREKASLVFDQSSGQLVLFGGLNNSGTLQDTWVLYFDTVTSLWNWQQLTPVNPPLSRCSASMVFDPCIGQVVLFGGERSPVGPYLQDTWFFDTREGANTWTQISPINPPNARSGASMNFDQSSGQIILFGGENGNTKFNDTWALETKDNVNTWTNLNPAAPPPARSSAMMNFDQCIGVITLFGGNGNNGLLNDTWTYDNNAGDNTWTQLTITAPPPREGALMSFDQTSGQLILFGGMGSSGALNDTWAFGTPSNGIPIWTNLMPSNSPAVRDGPSMAFNPTSGQMILFGGCPIPTVGCSSNYQNDTWAYDGDNNTWLDVTPAVSPRARNGATMCFDPTTGQIILFGGDSQIGYLNDTWAYSYDSVSNSYIWTDVTPATSPSIRYAQAMAYDPSSGKIIMFGGYNNSSGDLGDTWAFDSLTNTWTELFPANSPSIRDSSYMAFDPASGQIILFGGYHNGSLGETWAYDGFTNNWTQITTTGSPSNRYGFRMDYDPCMGQMILFGGGYGPPYHTLADTWAYNSFNQTWTELTPINSPAAREFAATAFDPSTGQLILFGGVNLETASTLNDTWALTLAFPPLFTSPNNATFQVGVFSSFTITTTGFPNPVITEVGALPPGITFVDNGDGTATLSGTPTGGVGSYPIVFNADNGIAPSASQNFTLVISAIPIVLPPTKFIGVVKENKFLNKTEYILTATWNPSPSPNVVAYRIYKGGQLFEVISAHDPLIFTTCLHSKNEARSFQITAVNSSGLESVPVTITIAR